MPTRQKLWPSFYLSPSLELDWHIPTFKIWFTVGKYFFQKKTSRMISGWRKEIKGGYACSWLWWKKMFIINRREIQPEVSGSVWGNMTLSQVIWRDCGSRGEDNAVLVAKRAKGKRAGLVKMSEFYMGEQLGEGQTIPWAGEFRVVGGLCWPGGLFYK